MGDIASVLTDAEVAEVEALLGLSSGPSVPLVPPPPRRGPQRVEVLYSDLREFRRLGVPLDDFVVRLVNNETGERGVVPARKVQKYLGFGWTPVE